MYKWYLELSHTSVVMIQHSLRGFFRSILENLEEELYTLGRCYQLSPPLTHVERGGSAAGGHMSSICSTAC